MATGRTDADRGHTSTVDVEQRAVMADSKARSGCINKDFLSQQFLTDLVSGEPLNDGHRATAVRTNP